MELLRQNIHMDCRDAGGELQITLEDDLNLSETKPDVSSLCMEKGCVMIEELRPMADAVSVRGRLVFTVLYHTQEEGGHLESTEGKILFEEKIRVEGLTATDNVSVTGKVDDLTVNVINSRKLGVQSVITLSASVETIRDEVIPVGVADVGEDRGTVQFRQIPMEFSQIVLNKKDVVRVKEDISLPSGCPNIGRILLKTVELGEMNFRLGEEKLYVQGEIKIFVLYVGEDEETTPQIYETVSTVSAEIVCAGCRDGMAVDTRYGISQWELIPRPDMDGEQRDLGLEATIELKICIYEDRQVEVVTDVYGVTKEIDGDKKTAQLKKLLRCVTGKTKVADHIKMENGDEILQLVHSEAEPALSSIEAVEDGIVLRGIVAVKILYVTGDDEQPYGSLRTNIPFEYCLEIPGMTPEESPGKVQTCLEQLSVTMLDGAELDVKAVLCFSTVVFRSLSEEVIGAVNEKPLDNEKMASLPSMVVYVVKPGDNLWNIGKQYYVPVQSLMDLNDLPTEELHPGQKLLVVKEG